MTSASKKKSSGNPSCLITDPTEVAKSGGSVIHVVTRSTPGRQPDIYNLEQPITIGDYTYPLVDWLGNVSDTVIRDATGISRYTLQTIRRKLQIDSCTLCAFKHKTTEKLERITRQVTCPIINDYLKYGRPSGIDSHLYTLGGRHSQSLRAQQQL